jgi:hypothetical protein
MPESGGPSRPPSVRVASLVANDLSHLPEPQRAAVTAAIRNIGNASGIPLRGPADEGKRYMIVVPADDDRAPVVIYRELPEAEGGGYLVTGLGERETYNGAVKPRFLETPAGQALVSVAGAAAAAVDAAVADRSDGGSRS